MFDEASYVSLQVVLTGGVWRQHGRSSPLLPHLVLASSVKASDAILSSQTRVLFVVAKLILVRTFLKITFLNLGT